MQLNIQGVNVILRFKKTNKDNVMERVKEILLNSYDERKQGGKVIWSEYIAYTEYLQKDR